MKFATHLRRLAVVFIPLVASMMTSFISTSAAGAADKATATINGGCRVSGDPDVISGTGSLDVEKSEWAEILIVFFTPTLNDGVYLHATQLHFTGAQAASGAYEFTYRTPNFTNASTGRTVALPKTPVVISWVASANITKFASGSFKLGTGTCSSTPASTTTAQPPATTNPIPVSVNVTVGGILSDRLSGTFPAKALSTKLQAGNLLSVSGTASFHNSQGNPAQVTWKLNRTGASKPWKGHLTVVDRTMNIVSSFARTLKVSQAETGQMTGSAASQIVQGHHRNTLQLIWSIQAA